MAIRERRTSAAVQRTHQSYLSMERWRFPVRFGIGFTALQLMVFVIRFGLDGFPSSGPVDLIRLTGPVSGLFLFFLGGVLAGLFVQRLLRDATGAWRRFLIGGIVVATPLAVLLSLAGGLLGPPVIIINAVVPYVVLAGIPAAVRTIWLRMAGSAGFARLFRRLAAAARTAWSWMAGTTTHHTS